jgi:hypothetical protein
MTFSSHFQGLPEPFAFICKNNIITSQCCLGAATILLFSAIIYSAEILIILTLNKTSHIEDMLFGSDKQEEASTVDAIVRVKELL